MTNETTLHDEGAADPDSAAIAATINEAGTEAGTEAGAAAAPAANGELAAEPAEPPAPSFDDLGLHPDVRLALDEMGYFAPTPVQTAVYKPVSEGKDLLVQSRTGTGKTTAFGLPAINNLIPTHRAPQVLILTPTRELALQVARELTSLGKHRGILIEPIYGGAPIGKQIKALKEGVHIIVGTPGRVLDHIGRRTLDCKTISTFILDECDEMLSMGFLEDIERVVSHLPDKKQTLLFSATMPDEVTRYARRHMVSPEQISLSRDSISVAEIHHAYYIVSGIARSRDLLKIIFAEEPESAIVFCNTRDETTMVAKFLRKQGLDAEPLSSDLSQSDRERVMGRMKQKNLRFLCATDVAARGIDISDLSHVINYSVPEQPEVYVHRTGRTGRAGKKGTALSLVGPRELGNFRYVRLQFGLKPEERVLPKDDIFEGKLKVPLPPVGTPQPPDPVQILIRGVQGTPSELESKIFEKLYATQNGRRVLARLVAEKLDALSTRSRPKRPAREDREDRERGEDRGERRFDRDRGERRDREDRGERRFDRDRDRDRGERRDREDRGERRFDRDRDRDRGERRFDRDRDRDRGERRGREEREGREERRERREERGERRFDRDRDRDRDRGERREREAPRPEQEVRPEPAAEVAAPLVAEAADLLQADAPVVVAEEPARERRPERGERRDRHRARHERGERRERHAPTEVEPMLEVGTEAAPPVETAEVEAEAEHATKVDDVARAVLERADRDRKGKKKAAPAAETREFWETWAEEKSTREPAAPAAAAPADTEEAGEQPERKTRSRSARDKGGRTREDKKTRRDLPKTRAAEREDNGAGGRSKRDTAVTPPPAMSADAQARLFVNLGKKHGVSADDLRELLSGPIGGDKSRIGSVSLRDSHAHVRVPEDLVDAIIEGVNGTHHKDHDVTVERARA